MDQRMRLQYLDAMGIDVWQPRPGISSPEHDVVGGDNASQEIINDNQRAGITEAWARIKAGVKHCQACTLCEQRTNTVFGVGNENADWLVIGEAPGRDEDLQGEPFVGRAGKLLDQMLLALGLSREQVYIANVVKCRPPQNRDPRPDEMASCADFLRRQIELIQPKIILLVGRVAAQSLLNTTDNVGRMRGTQHTYADTQIPMVVTYHPAYLLRSPLEKRKSWQDLQFAYRIYMQK